MAAITKNDAGGITVSYPVRESLQDISKADYYAVRCIGDQNKVRAIKFLRMQTGLGLYESKQIVDTILAHADVLANHDGSVSHQPPTSLGALLRAKLDGHEF